MTRPEDIPEWAWEMADEASGRVSGWNPLRAGKIARALIAAEQRGAERAAEIAIEETKAPGQRNAKDQWVEQIGQRIANAIRGRKA